MRFKYFKIDKIPKLSWCTVLKKNFEKIYVYHGKGVETKNKFFLEGAWNDDFEKANFDESTFFLGSGGKVDNIRGGGGVCFASPGHTQERLYSILDDEIMFVSNSFPFILYMSKTNIDNKYFNYEADFNSILKGINNYKRDLRLDDKKEIKLHYYCNIKIGYDLEITEIQKKEEKPFKDFADYEDRLILNLSNLIANAQYYGRENKYGLVTTISRGYDAASCAAIAKILGCEKVVSFNSPKKYIEDCGDQIAKKLGYKNIILKDADEYMANIDVVEAEYLSSGELGSGIIFTAFEDEYKNNIVFNGERGDKIWDKNWIDYNNEFRFVNEVFSGTSYTENRLRVGYISLPMPLFGATQWASINKINNSEEMKKYSIGGNYDRPIPRRILETRGIKREDFGMEKKGAGFNYRFDNLKRIKKRMSKKSFDSFSKFYEENKRKDINTLLAWTKYLWETKSIYLSYIMGKIGIKVRSKKLSADAYINPGAPAYLFHWAVDEMKNRYNKSDIDRWWLESDE